MNSVSNNLLAEEGEESHESFNIPAQESTNNSSLNSGYYLHYDILIREKVLTIPDKNVLLLIEFTFINDNFSGVANKSKALVTSTMQEALDILKKHELQHTVSYAIFSSKKGFGETSESTKIFNFFRILYPFVFLWKVFIEKKTN